MSFGCLILFYESHFGHCALSSIRRRADVSSLEECRRSDDAAAVLGFYRSRDVAQVSFGVERSKQRDTRTLGLQLERVRYESYDSVLSCSPKSVTFNPFPVHVPKQSSVLGSCCFGLQQTISHAHCPTRNHILSFYQRVSSSSVISFPTTAALHSASIGTKDSRPRGAKHLEKA